MDAFKQAVVQTLEKQGIIAQLKAQLRAQVFLAVEEYDSTSTGLGGLSKTSIPARNLLLSESEGQLAVQLVLDLLDTCNFAFTKRVFQPELGSKAPDVGRQTIIQTLGLKPSSADEPLLVTLLKAFKTGSTRPSGQALLVSSAGPMNDMSSSRGPPATAPASGPPPPVAAPSVSSSAASALPVRPAPAVAPLARVEPLGKPTLGPLPALGMSAPKTSDSGMPGSKPQPEPSTGYDDDFEDVEDDTDAAALGDEGDDEDLVAALGFKTTSGTASKDSGEGGKERLGAGLASSSSRGRTALDADLMAGDRSFGYSNELAGFDVGNSGGLSYSADFPGGISDMRGSLSSSQAMQSPINEGTPKSTWLEPLRPLVPGKLSPLAPLPSISSSLASSKDDSLASKGPKPFGTLTAPLRKSLADLEKEKEEMRRLVMLQSGDSLSNSIEVESRPRPMGAPYNIYDAEVSISASMDDAAWDAGGGAPRNDRQPVYKNKGMSMDLGATGLSASDRSGDIEHLGVDFTETAEWH